MLATALAAVCFIIVVLEDTLRRGYKIQDRKRATYDDGSVAGQAVVLEIHVGVSGGGEPQGRL